jgi:hypothetical protein
MNPVSDWRQNDDLIFEIIRRINRQDGVSLLLVEQNAGEALLHADRGYVVRISVKELLGITDEPPRDRGISWRYGRCLSSLGIRRFARSLRWLDRISLVLKKREQAPHSLLNSKAIGQFCGGTAILLDFALLLARGSGSITDTDGQSTPSRWRRTASNATQ